MIELLLKSSVAIGLALVFYKLVLQQESFFATNRMYLLSCIVLAFALPYVSLPKMIEQQGYLERIFQEEISEEVAPKLAFSENKSPAVILKAPSENLPAEEYRTGPAVINPSVVTAIIESKEPETSLAENFFYQNMSLWDFIALLYLFGVGIFSVSLLFQMGSIVYEIATARDKIRDGQFIIVNTTTPKAPCSFFNYIFIYPDDYDFETYEQIIAHEKTHVRLRHSYDLLLAELAVITLWFNPFIWFFKKEIEKNNEYQTDAVLLEKHEVRKDKYQLNLLQIAVPNKPLNITTNYNQSLIKQRIVMMNSKKSTPHAYWKYGFMLPLFFGMLLLLNEPALSQEKEEKTSAEVDEKVKTSGEKSTAKFPIRKENLVSERHNLVERKPHAVREPEQLQERAAEVQTRRENSSESIIERTAIVERRNLSLTERGAQVDMTKGVWYSSIENGNYCIEFKGGDDNSRWNMSDCFNISDFQKRAGDTFLMTNEVGILELKGNLDAEVGQGKYTFIENNSFRDFINKNGFADVNKSAMFHLFFGNMTKDYINFLKNEYPRVEGDDLVALAIHGVKQDKFRSYVSLFENYSSGNAGIDDVISLKIHGVTETYIKELQNMGFTDLSMNDIMSAKIHGVSTAYFQDLKKAGFTDLSMDEIVTAKIHGVEPQTIKEMRALGAMDLDKIVELKIHNVSADYVRELETAGLGDLSLDEIISAKVHGLDLSTIKEIRNMGFENLDFDDLLTAQIHRINPLFVKDLEQAGFTNLDINEIVSAKIHGIDGEFIATARKNGYDLNSIDKYISLKIHGSAMESLKNQ